ncbi:MAG: hypothetical protein Q7S92_05625 [Candidatus Diapherotrites archaeon]|nr:hypothetical protein [Candidatus Diapherotrites archaeon]
MNGHKIIGIFSIVLAILLISVTAFAVTPTGVAVTAPVNGTFLKGNIDFNFTWDDANSPAHARVDGNLFLRNSTGEIVVISPNIDLLTLCDINVSPHTCTLPVNTVLIPDGTYSVGLTVTDNEGNASALYIRAGTFVIDNTVPTITLVVTPGAVLFEDGWYLGYPVITATIDSLVSGTAIQQYRFDGTGAWNNFAGNSFSTAGLADGNHSVDVNIIDRADNVTVSQISFSIDRLAPTTTVTYSSEFNPATVWQNRPFTVILTCDDLGIGCGQMHYTVDSNPETVEYMTGDGNVNISIAENGTHRITFYSVDQLGHQEAVQLITVNLDTTIPAVTFLNPTETGVMENTARIVFKVNGATTGSPIVLNSLSVKINGIASRSFNDNRGSVCSGPANSITCSYAESLLVPNQAYTITVTARDTADNNAIGSMSFRTVSTIVGAVQVIQPNGNQYIKGNSQILFDANTNGLADLNAFIQLRRTGTVVFTTLVDNYDLNAQTCNGAGDFFISRRCSFDFNTQTIVDGNYIVQISLRGIKYNNLGQRIEYTSPVDVSDSSFIIDNTRPVVNFTIITPVNGIMDLNAWRNFDFNAVFSASDATAGIATLQYNLNNSGFVSSTNLAQALVEVKTEGENTILVRAIDRAGNQTDINAKVYLDKSKPVLSNELPVNNSFTNKIDSNISVNVTDTLSGLVNNSLRIVINGTNFPIGNSRIDFTNGVLKLIRNTWPHGAVVQVQAFARDTAGNDQNLAWTFTVDTVRPRNINDLRSTLDSNNDIQLQFTVPTDDLSGIGKFRIYRAFQTMDARNYSQYFLAEVDANSAINTTTNIATIVDDVNVQLDNVYFYVVTAVDQAGNESAVSNLVRQESGKRFKYISITPKVMPLVMETTDTATAVFELKNISSGRQCFTLRAVVGGDPYVRAQAEQGRICLESNQTLTTGVTITTLNSPAVQFDLNLIAVLDNGTFTQDNASTTVIVGLHNVIQLDSVTGTVTAGKFDTISVIVRNTGSTAKMIKLRASSPMFLPVVVEPELEIRAGQTKNIDVRMYIPSNVPVGSYDFILTAINGNEVTQRTVFFNVVAGNTESIPTFTVSSMDFNGVCKDARKERNTPLEFSIENLLNEIQTISLQSYSDIQSNIVSEVTLEPKEKKTVYLDVHPVIEDETGNYDIQLYSWSTGFTAEPVVKCANVLGMAYGNAELIDNDVTLVRGSQREFEILLRNTGDSEQTFRIRTPTQPEGILVSSAVSTVTLLPREERRIRVTVTAAENADLQNYSLPVVVEGQPVQNLALLFNVVQGFEGNLDLTNYPIKVTAEKNASQLVSVTIVNSSNQVLENIVLTMERLPEGVTFPTRMFTLSPGESITVVQKLSIAPTVESGTYEPKLVVRVGDLERKETIDLEIKQPAAAAPAPKPVTSMTGEQILSGLVGLGQSVPLGLLIIVAVLIVFLAFKPARSIENEQVWMRK